MTINPYQGLIIQLPEGFRTITNPRQDPDYSVEEPDNSDHPFAS